MNIELEIFCIAGKNIPQTYCAREKLIFSITASYNSLTDRQQMVLFVFKNVFQFWVQVSSRTKLFAVALKLNYDDA